MRTMHTAGAIIASVALLPCCGAQAAGSITVTPMLLDRAVLPAVVTLPDITVTLGNNLVFQDDVRITVDGATVDMSAGFPSAVTCSPPDSGPFPMGFLFAGGDSWNFRVTTISGIAAGSSCTFRDLKVSGSSIAADCAVATINARYEAMLPLSGVIIDSAGPTLVADVTPCTAAIEVAIDIKPASMPNAINPRSRGNIPVAILSTENFYAPADVDFSTLTFGVVGNEPSLLRCDGAGEDVNADGHADLVCHFATRLTGFGKGDELGHLAGTAVDGTPIEGRDSVRIVQ